MMHVDFSCRSLGLSVVLVGFVSVAFSPEELLLMSEVDEE